MKKPVLYIIHGWTYTTTPWEQTIALLKQKGLRVEMLHVPGLTSPSGKVWTIEDYVKWADRKIPTGAVALGHSNGGRILLNLCSAQPEKLKHLILLDAAGVYEVSGKRDLIKTVSKKLGFLKNIPGLAKVWHKLTGATDYARAPENMKQTLANMLDSDSKLDLTKITTPTSILWGEADTVTPPRQAEMMHQQIADSTLEIFPGWTHAPYISHPLELARAIYKAYLHPPVVRPREVNETTARSAALAIKKAPNPTLEAKEPNPVAPDVATKLVLRKDAKITKGLRASDQEGAAVKYSPKRKEIAQKSTDVAKESASASLKKARTDKAPDIDAAAASASANVKKNEKKPVVPSIISSAKILSGKDEVEPTGILRELDQESADSVDFVPLEGDRIKVPGMISSASVPKVSRIEKVKRKVKDVKAKGKKST